MWPSPALPGRPLVVCAAFKRGGAAADYTLDMSEFAHSPNHAPDPDPEGLLLDQFLSLLPSLPTEIGVFSAGGVATVVLADLDRGLLIGYAPQMLMQPGLTIVCPLRDSSGGGYDVSLRIEKAYFQSSNQTLIHVRVIEIVHQPGHRRTKRAQRTDDAEAVVLRSKALPDGEHFHVRTADISEGGVAFVTELNLSVGDRVMLSIYIGARPITLEALVMRVEPISFGRYRIGCEVDAIAEHDRRTVAQIAEAAQDGHVDERDPEVTAARIQGRAEQHALKSRLAVRRYMR
jgi:PilZ domain